MPQKITKDVEHLVDILDKDYKRGRDIDIKSSHPEPDTRS